MGSLLLHYLFYSLQLQKHVGWDGRSTLPSRTRMCHRKHYDYTESVINHAKTIIVKTEGIIMIIQITW